MQPVSAQPEAEREGVICVELALEPNSEEVAKSGTNQEVVVGRVKVQVHIGVGARRDRFATIDKRGRRCLRERAHGLGE